MKKKTQKEKPETAFKDQMRIMINKALDSASAQITEMIKSHDSQILQSYLDSEEGKVNIGSSIEIRRDNMNSDVFIVKAQIQFIESRVRDFKITKITNQTDMFS